MAKPITMTPRDHYLSALLQNPQTWEVVKSPELALAMVQGLAEGACGLWGHLPEYSECIRCGADLDDKERPLTQPELALRRRQARDKMRAEEDARKKAGNQYSAEPCPHMVTISIWDHATRSMQQTARAGCRFHKGHGGGCEPID